MTKTLTWHSTLATDRPVYHNDTRCPEGGTIELKDLRPGSGGREPCEHCAELLIQTIAARLFRANGPVIGGVADNRPNRRPGNSA